MTYHRTEKTCTRCKRVKPFYAKRMCHSCYCVSLYYYRQGRPLPPYRVRVRTCHGCSAAMPGRADLYCSGQCRQTSAQRRRSRQASRRLGPLRPWFRYLKRNERDVLERRLAGETHAAIGRVHGWTRQYNQQLESILLGKLMHIASSLEGTY